MKMVKGMNKKINLKKISIIVGIVVAVLAGIADFTNIYDWIATPDVQQQTSPSTNRNKGTYVSNSGIKLSVSRNDSVIIKQSYIDKDGKKHTIQYSQHPRHADDSFFYFLVLMFLLPLSMLFFFYKLEKLEYERDKKNN